MRILSWNYLEGGFGPPASDGTRLPDPIKRQHAQALVAKFNPDVVVLNEALYAEPFAGQLAPYGEIFGYPHTYARLYDGAWGNAILSRHPIAETQLRLIHRARGQNRGFIAALIEPPGGEPIWVSTYHPHPQRRPHKRAEDFTEFLARVQDAPAVLCGDLNAISPEDAPDEAALVANFLLFQKPGIAQASVRRMIEAGELLFNHVLPKFGWRDGILPSGRAITLPTALIRKPGDQGLRIDHALISPHLRVIEGMVVHDADADLASDHYPLLLDIEVQ